MAAITAAAAAGAPRRSSAAHHPQKLRRVSSTQKFSDIFGTWYGDDVLIHFPAFSNVFGPKAAAAAAKIETSRRVEHPFQGRLYAGLELNLTLISNST